MAKRSEETAAAVAVADETKPKRKNPRKPESEKDTFPIKLNPDERARVEEFISNVEANIGVHISVVDALKSLIKRTLTPVK
jgi:hypothetical protein